MFRGPYFACTESPRPLHLCLVCYPMTKTQFIQKRGVRKCVILAWLPWCFYRSWDKSKNPCPCENRTFPNKGHHQNLQSTQPVALCSPGPDDALHLEMFYFAWAWVLAIFSHTNSFTLQYAGCIQKWLLTSHQQSLPTVSLAYLNTGRSKSLISGLSSQVGLLVGLLLTGCTIQLNPSQDWNVYVSKHLTTTRGWNSLCLCHILCW